MSDKKKRIHPGRIVASGDERAVLLHFELVESELHADGTEGEVKKRTQDVKKLRLTTPLTTETDLVALAQQMQAGCKYIKDSALPRVRDALQVLQQRDTQGGSAAPLEAERPASRHGVGRKDANAPDRDAERKSSGDPKRVSTSGSSDMRAQGSQLRGRRKGIHADDGKGKKSGSSSKKSRRERMSNESREAKKAVLEKEQELHELQQRQFQKRLFESQARKYAAADIERLEEYMEQVYEEDLAQKVNGLGMIAQLFRKAANLPVLLDNNALLQLLARTYREAARKSMDLAISVVSVFFSISNFSSFHELLLRNKVGAETINIVELELQRTALRKQETGIVPADVGRQIADTTLERSSTEQKMITIVQKQDRLLYLSFYLLLNLAEDVPTERKMTKRHIVPHLIEMLARCNVELLILAVTFLKRLSVYRENKTQMIECDIIGKLSKFVPSSNPVLMMAILRLLHNLSFDESLRQNIVDAGMVPTLVDLMREPRLAPICMGVLYQISTDDKHKSLFTYTHAIKIVYERLMSIEDLRREPELIALAVNLTQNHRCASALCEGPNFDRLMKRAVDSKDDLLYKVMRNCSQVDDLALKRRFSPYVERCVMLLRAQGVTPDLFVEVLGTLANLNVPEFDFEALVQRHDLLNFLAQFAEPGVVDDDILLEVIMFLGVICNEGTAQQIADSGLIEMLFHHMGEKKEDDEFVLQITFTFSKLLAHQPTCKGLLENTDVIDYLVQLLQDTNKEVRKHADKALDVLMETQPTRAAEVRENKFRTFNAEWLHVIEHPDEFDEASHLTADSLVLGSDADGRRTTDSSHERWSGAALGVTAAIADTLANVELPDDDCSDDDLDASYLRSV